MNILSTSQHTEEVTAAKRATVQAQLRLLRDTEHAMCQWREWMRNCKGNNKDNSVLCSYTDSYTANFTFSLNKINIQVMELEIEERDLTNVLMRITLQSMKDAVDSDARDEQLTGD